jgi:hypothetical protein
VHKKKVYLAYNSESLRAWNQHLFSSRDGSMVEGATTVGAHARGKDCMARQEVRKRGGASLALFIAIHFHEN